MNKKWGLLGALAAAAVIVVLAFQFLMPKSNGDQKNIQVTIIDQHEPETVLFEGEIETNSETLGDMLKEQEEFAVELEDSEYGSFIVSMGEIAGDDEYFWVYESDNNQSCKDMGMCPAVDECILQDEDAFTFILTNTFE